MSRSRARQRRWACASAALVVAVLAAAPGSLAAAEISPPPANAPPPATDTMTVLPGYVPASSVTTLAFTFTAAEYILRHDISLTIPAGWTAPSHGGPDGGITVACAQSPKYCDLDSQPVSIAGQQITVGVSYLNVGQSLTITYSHATTPGAAMTYAFDALERSQANMVGKLPSVEITPWTPVTPSPTVTVTCADGTGTAGVSPVAVPAARPTQLTFTYTAPSCAVNEATVTLTVPDGWTPPSPVSGPGEISSSLGSAALSVSGRTIAASGVTLAAGQAFSITYDQAETPTAAITYPFTATERSAPAGTLTGLLTSPQVTVLAQVSPTVSPSVSASPSASARPSKSASPSAPASAGAAQSESPTTSQGVQPVTSGGPSTSGNSLGADGSPGPSSSSTSGTPSGQGSTGPGPSPSHPAPGEGPGTSAAAATPGPVGTPAASPDQTTGADAGTITVSPGTVSPTNPGSLTFTYWAPLGGVTPTGEITMLVPDGWTPPSAVPGAAGYTTSEPDPLQMSGMRITITGITLSPGQPLAITYRPTAAPRLAGRWVFLTSERSAATGALTTLSVSPAVLVSLSSPLHIPVPLVAALVAAGFAAAAIGVRFLRHRTAGRRRFPRHRRTTVPTAGRQTVAHTGPPGQVSVQPTRNAATHAVTIQPVYVPRGTTIEESPSEETPP